MTKPTPRQREILQYIRTGSPSIRQIAAHFSISPSAVQQHIELLRKKGLIPKSEKN